MQLLEKTKLRQFIRRPDGKLVRFYLTVPLMLTAATAAQPLGPPDNNHILRAEYKDTFTIDRVTKDNEGVYNININMPSRQPCGTPRG